MNDPRGFTERSIRTGCRKNGQEFRPVLSVIAQTITTSDTVVPRTEQHARSPGAQFREIVADSQSVVVRNSLFIVPVGDSESLRDRLLVKKEIEERKERFVDVCGCVPIWDVRWRAANTTELKVKKPGTCQGKVEGTLTCSRYWGLDKSNQQRTECLDSPIKPSVWVERYSHVRLHLGARVTLVIAAIGYLNDFKVPTNCVRPKRRDECLGDRMSRLERSFRQSLPHLEVSVVGKLIQVTRNTQ